MLLRWAFFMLSWIKTAVVEEMSFAVESLRA